MTNGSRKGDRRERELINILDDQYDYAVMRAPASGSATKRELPDVLAGSRGHFLAIEAKARADATFYVDGGEIVDLRFFAANFGAEPRVGVRFDLEHGDPGYGTPWKGWYLAAPEDLHQTDGGNYRVKRETIRERGRPLPKALSDRNTPTDTPA